MAARVVWAQPDNNRVPDGTSRSGSVPADSASEICPNQAAVMGSSALATIFNKTQKDRASLARARLVCPLTARMRMASRGSARSIVLPAWMSGGARPCPPQGSSTCRAVCLCWRWSCGTRRRGALLKGKHRALRAGLVQRVPRLASVLTVTPLVAPCHLRGPCSATLSTAPTAPVAAIETPRSSTGC